MAAFEKISKLQFFRDNALSGIDIRKARLPPSAVDDDYDPRDNRDPKTPIEPWMAYFNLLRTLCGVGLLGMPVAISASGLIVGAIITVLIGLLIIHTHYILLDNLNEISKQLKIPYISYRYGFRLALLRGPEIWHSIGSHGPTIIAVFMVLSQLGLCTVCVILTSDSLRDIVDSQSTKPSLLTLLPCYLIMQSLMKDLTRVSYVALFGNFLNTVGLVMIFYHIFKEPQHHVTLFNHEIGGYLFTCGMCMFNLSAVGVILALDKAIEKPKIMIAPYGVINVGVGIPTILSLVFGALGYWAFGPMEENVLRALPYEDISSMIAIGVYLISMAFTYPLQCYPAIAILVEVIKYRDTNCPPPSEETLKIFETIARPTFVLLSFVIAYFVPFQGPFVAFVGSLCTSMLSVVFPVMMDISLRYNKPGGYGKFRIHLFKNLIIMAMGILAWILGVYYCGYLIYIRILSNKILKREEFY